MATRERCSSRAQCNHTYTRVPSSAATVAPKIGARARARAPNLIGSQWSPPCNLRQPTDRPTEQPTMLTRASTFRSSLLEKFAEGKRESFGLPEALRRPHQSKDALALLMTRDRYRRSYHLRPLRARSTFVIWKWATANSGEKQDL